MFYWPQLDSLSTKISKSIMGNHSSGGSWAVSLSPGCSKCICTTAKMTNPINVANMSRFERFSETNYTGGGGGGGGGEGGKCVTITMRCLRIYKQCKIEERFIIIRSVIMVMGATSASLPYGISWFNELLWWLISSIRQNCHGITNQYSFGKKIERISACKF